MHAKTLWGLLSILCGASCTPATATATAAPKAQLTDPLRLGRSPSPGIYGYRVATEIVTFSEAGAPIGTERYALDIVCRSQDPTDRNQGACTCKNLTFERNHQPSVSIPALAGWSYPFAAATRWYDEKGQAYGIAHTRFEGLHDSKGQPVPPEVEYQAYSLFLYFHDLGHGLLGGVSELKLARLGQSATLSIPTSSLEFGSMFTTGSTFEHDEMRVELRGLTLLEHTTAAIVGFESGGRLTMLGAPTPHGALEVRGRSRFVGDLYVDLETLWPKRVRMTLTDALKIAMGKTPVGNQVFETTLTIASNAELR